MKVFLDTNVLESAVLTRGLCADILREVLGNHYLVVSPNLIDELKRILFCNFGIPSSLVSEIVPMLRTDSEVSKPDKPADIRIPIRDTDDIIILADALSAGVEVFVTGD